MGATNFSATATGRDANEAFNAARDAADAEHGHEQGYSGEINAKSGFSLITLPAGVSHARFQAWLGKASEAAWIDADAEYATPADLRKAKTLRNSIPEKHRSLVARTARQADDKWGNAVAYRLPKADEKRAKADRGLAGTREQVFYFFGTASC